MAARDGHVHVLPLHVANKIAAGEVVERPASVVKELVENSVDAGATNIKVSIAQGGRKLVSVRDDGCGMTKDDALLSLERQATSKILDVDDIENIDTLGFRGEAIPSIASVSRFSLVTRRHDADEGTQIVVNAGELVETSTAGCPPGTLVEVRDLFCNVPARRKFLRSFATEEGRVKGIFTVHALAHPGIGFSLVVDGRELYRLAPATSLADRLLDIYGADFVESLIPLPPPSDAQRNAVRVSGYIEKPNLSMPTRRDQYVFVNGRPATAPSIAYAVREAYPHRQGDIKPALFLFIELPANQVDVNVHPTKREVRFRDNIALKRAITEAIEGALGLRPTASNVAASEMATSETTGTNRTNGTDDTDETKIPHSPTPQLSPTPPTPSLPHHHSNSRTRADPN
ncbi:MAG: DNA mismatch repair endonuclease MutL [Kiritimatiellae bacterium]|nr:DNA mismatch repair endonuclease MutL [Kiritimatiellia bacterium]